ncbi:hypothetical protein [Paraburkholderia sp.]|uniref:hypothetical protein n=1 Tax=Paraburkholderia sp. TaxID=1926495 RepID=UPI003D6E84EE
MTALVGMACTAASAYINLVGSHALNTPGAIAQPGWMACLHVGTTLLGSVLLARFVQGSPAALKGPALPSTVGTAMLARVGTVRMVVPGKSAFFSTRRTLQLLGFIFCLMLQFVSVAPPAQDPGARPVAVRQLAT